MVVANDDLKGLFCALKNGVGYEPGVSYACNRFIALTLKFNNININIIIRTQQLVTTILDGNASIEKEQTYNRMNEAMTLVHNHILEISYKSFYSNQDIDLLDEYSSRANIGFFHRQPDNIPLIEVDRTKAYLWALQNITVVPIFNVFDIWKPFKMNKSKITLYT